MARTQFGVLDDNVRDYMGEVVSYVRDRSFSELVSAIYREYPEMQENSVFWGDFE